MFPIFVARMKEYDQLLSASFINRFSLIYMYNQMSVEIASLKYPFFVLVLSLSTV
jgi:hypothetical protein